MYPPIFQYVPLGVHVPQVGNPWSISSELVKGLPLLLEPDINEKSYGKAFLMDGNVQVSVRTQTHTCIIVASFEQKDR